MLLTTAVLALVFALVVAAVVVVVARRRRAKSAQPVAIVEAPADLHGVTPHAGEVERGRPLPVVLVHGLFGFDRIGLPGARLDYFRGIARHLDQLGCDAHAVRLPPSSSVPARAQELVLAIDALPHPRIDLVAHSLGGLDARYALSHLGLSRRVRSLVTIGTPHRGTPIADLATRGPLHWARKLLGAVGLSSMEALEWLSTDSLARFNRDVPDHPGVRYACVVGGLRARRPRMPLPLVPAHAYLRRVAGANDGLVPMSSQYWGETLAEIEADHWAQIGWMMSVRSTPFDALGLYAFVVARLGDAPPIQHAIASAQA